ncbi:hypothetical protein [Ktedonobacter robiniae]|uniref:Uncharacterized protein n=1 Tax=Ktedonobacter robiniae TaxID=2778365 RepID=A0ABQ3UM62_9CHLR|nr:hypothetical protein [Ktedonobacter robiniae]GHO53829.1 hypothetical protein KSB_23040 [Ktedonobacter robiniae]
MELLDFTILVLSFVIVVFLAAILFIRPSRAVLIASLLGGLVLALVNVLFDVIAAYANFWHYVFTAPKPSQRFPWNIDPQAFYHLVTHFPVTYYISTGLVYGSIVYLLIWRFEKGPKAWFAKLLLFGIPLFCILRDVYGAATHTAYLHWDSMGGIVLTVLLWPIAFYAGYLLFKKLAPSHQVIEAQRQEEEEREAARIQALKAASSQQ